MTDLRELFEALRVSEGAVLVPVRAHPRARTEGLTGVHAGALRIATTCAADGGKATQSVARILARALDISPSRVHCVTGATCRQKVFRVEGLDRAQVRTRLRETLR